MNGLIKVKGAIARTAYRLFRLKRAGDIVGRTEFKPDTAYISQPIIPHIFVNVTERLPKKDRIKERNYSQRIKGKA